jgi:hypothetical protein
LAYKELCAGADRAHTIVSGTRAFFGFERGIAVRDVRFEYATGGPPYAC